MFERRLKFRKIVIAGAGVLVFLIFLTATRWQAGGLKNGFHRYLGNPIILTFNFAEEKSRAVGLFFSGLTFRASEKKQLEEMILVLTSQNIRLKEVVRENEFLKENLGILNEKKSELVMAKVVAQDQNAINSVLIIDKGEKSGVKKGQAVIVGPAVLVGRVFEVGDSFAKIRLLTDSQSQINAIVQGKNLQGILRGRHGLGILLERIPWGENLEKGDAVLSSGLNQDVPAGLLIGLIEEVGEEKTDPNQSARIKSSAEVEVLDYVFVMK